MLKGDYYFPLYYQKLLASTQGWKDDELGAYIRLLIYQYDKGFIPNDMAMITRISPTAKKNWALLSTKFLVDEQGNLYNEVMKQIRDTRLKKSKTLSENGQKGGRPKNQMESNLKPNGLNNESNINMVNGLLVNGSKVEDVLEAGDGFFINDLDPKMLLTEMQIGATTQFIRIKTGKMLTTSQVMDQWEAFKIQNFNLKKWYNSIEDLLGHFRNSLNLETQKNGTHKQTLKSSVRKSAGAEALLADLKADIASSGAADYKG